MRIDWAPELKPRGEEAAAAAPELPAPDPRPKIDPNQMPREKYLLACVLDVMATMPGLQRMIKDPSKLALGGLIRCVYGEFTDAERAEAIAALPEICKARENGWSRMVGITGSEAERRAARAYRIGEEMRDRLMHIERDDPDFLARAACAEYNQGESVDLDDQELRLWHLVVRRVIYELTGLDEIKW